MFLWRKGPWRLKCQDPQKSYAPLAPVPPPLLPAPASPVGDHTLPLPGAHPAHHLHARDQAVESQSKHWQLGKLPPFWPVAQAEMTRLVLTSSHTTHCPPTPYHQANGSLTWECLRLLAAGHQVYPPSERAHGRQMGHGRVEFSLLL